MTVDNLAIVLNPSIVRDPTCLDRTVANFLIENAEEICSSSQGTSLIHKIELKAVKVEEVIEEESQSSSGSSSPASSPEMSSKAKEKEEDSFYWVEDPKMPLSKRLLRLKEMQLDPDLSGEIRVAARDRFISLILTDQQLFTFLRAMKVSMQQNGVQVPNGDYDLEILKQMADKNIS